MEEGTQEADLEAGRFLAQEGVANPPVCMPLENWSGGR